MAHLSLERIEVCREHGELVHAAVASDAGDERASGGPATSPSGGGRDHDHCGLTPFVRETVRPAIAAAVVSSLAPVEVRGGVRESGGIERGVPLLLQAPKQSPPA